MTLQELNEHKTLRSMYHDVCSQRDELRSQNAALHATIQRLQDERDRALRELAEVVKAVEPILKMLKVGYNTNLVHLEINGVPVFRPLEAKTRDELGTLFTYLYNAQVAIDAASAAADQKEQHG